LRREKKEVAMERETSTLERLDDWRGEALYSSEHTEIGAIDAVFLDKETDKPEWLALRSSGPGSRRRLVPVSGAERRPDGVHVPYSLKQIESTPEVEGTRVSRDAERVLYSRYGLLYSERRSETGLPERPSERSSSQKGRRSGRAPASSRRGDGEPTRDELYQEAKRLDIGGRSKMNKKELARAVERHRGGAGATAGRKANPVEVQAFLEGVGYPTRTRDLVREAKSQRAGRNVRSTLERLPEERFGSPTEVSEAIGRLR
jgi:hypothetical protein